VKPRIWRASYTPLTYPIAKRVPVSMWFCGARDGLGLIVRGHSPADAYGWWLFATDPEAEMPGG
jgi:hypothetical protein